MMTTTAAPVVPKEAASQSKTPASIGLKELATKLAEKYRRNAHEELQSRQSQFPSGE